MTGALLKRKIPRRSATAVNDGNTAPLAPIGGSAAEIAFDRKVERLHARGPRFVGELLKHAARDRSLFTYFDMLLDEFLELEAGAVAVTGADHPVPPPLRVIDGGKP